jgi:hypothetical protein
MRITENLSDRVSGPMHMRFLLQPIMATLLAIRSGLKDAKAGRPPYFWSLIFHPYVPSRALLGAAWGGYAPRFEVNDPTSSLTPIKLYTRDERRKRS